MRIDTNDLQRSGVRVAMAAATTASGSGSPNFQVREAGTDAATVDGRPAKGLRVSAACAAVMVVMSGSFCADEVESVPFDGVPFGQASPGPQPSAAGPTVSSLENDTTSPPITSRAGGTSDPTDRVVDAKSPSEAAVTKSAAIFFSDFEADSATFVGNYVQYSDSVAGFTGIFQGGSQCGRLGTSTDRAYTGSRSYEWTFLGDGLSVNHSPPPRPPQGSCELRGTLGQGVHDLWIQWWLYVPDNYVNRNVVGNSENDKVLWMCGGFGCQEETNSPYQIKHLLEFGAYESAPGDSAFILTSHGTDADNPDGFAIRPTRGGGGQIIEPGDLGTWIEICVHHVVATRTGVANGVFNVYKDDELIGRAEALDNAPVVDRDAGFWNFYLMGAQNGGYPGDRITFYWDDLGFYTSDPGCT